MVINNQRGVRLFGKSSDISFVLAAVRFLHALARFSGRDFALIICAIISGALFEGIGLAMLLPLLAILTGTMSGYYAEATRSFLPTMSAYDRLESLSVLLAIFFILISMRAIVLSFRDRRITSLRYGFSQYERSQLLKVLGTSSWSNVAGFRHSRILFALDHDYDYVATSVHLILQLISAIWLFTVQLMIALIIAPVLAAFSMLLLAAGAIFMAPGLRRGWKIGQSVARQRLQSSGNAAQVMGSMKLAMAQDTQREFIAELAAQGQSIADQNIGLHRRYSNTRIIGSTCLSLAGAGAMVFGVWQEMSVAALIAGLAILTRMIGPVTSIQQQLQMLLEYLPAYFSQAALREELSSIEINVLDSSVEVVSGPIILRDVTYDYPGRQQSGVRELNFTIASGEFVGIDGPAGAGKTTLLDLVAGLLPPQVGDVSIGETPLDVSALRAWRRRLAYVIQDPYLFNDTIRSNIRFGGDVSDDVFIFHALDAVGASEFINRLPEGLETVVGERGAQLSGGQRQKIVLARALLRRPNVLILDEATSAIDIASEKMIFENLRRLTPRPTVLIVSHRAESLETCDRVITIAEGRLIAERTLEA